MNTIFLFSGNAENASMVVFSFTCAALVSVFSYKLCNWYFFPQPKLIIPLNELRINVFDPILEKKGNRYIERQLIANEIHEVAQGIL